MMAPKLIIDTDPGIDDTMAIFYALSSPELDVVGVTTVFGNAFAHTCTENALRLLEIADRTDIPVAAGAERPLAMPFHGGADFVHGVDGQGNTHLPPPKSKPVNKHAVQFLVDEIEEAPNEITIVALAPLTNIAMALLLQPEIAQNIHEIILMGGNAFVPGLATPTAEPNIWNDPEAADIVFGAACPITMIGLDVTEKIYMSPEQLDRIGTFTNPQSQHLARILRFYRTFYRERHGDDGIHVHDSTTITYLLNPSIFKTVHYPIRVETTGIGRGKTWPALGRSDREGPWAGRQHINICVDVIAEEAIRMELGCLGEIPA
jgi:inosine-uridine nucleoside N-ribohydrolase